MNEAAKLHRIMPGDYEGPARPPVHDGTVRECAVMMREHYADQRTDFYVELENGARLSGDELERVAVNEGE
ncbi:hypothetical protein [Sphingomonas citricola]|uniref:hypothetical protein n=1 Tax=Sphingomonas citricola TaxID=2862498 RepID=UPI001CA5CC44|nr:hypothetical protein [Sphingomonas citricola]